MKVSCAVCLGTEWQIYESIVFYVFYREPPARLKVFFFFVFIFCFFLFCFVEPSTLICERSWIMQFFHVDLQEFHQDLIVFFFFFQKKRRNELHWNCPFSAVFFLVFVKESAKNHLQICCFETLTPSPIERKKTHKNNVELCRQKCWVFPWQRLNPHRKRHSSADLNIPPFFEIPEVRKRQQGLAKGSQHTESDFTGTIYNSFIRIRGWVFPTLSRHNWCRTCQPMRQKSTPLFAKLFPFSSDNLTGNWQEPCRQQWWIFHALELQVGL